MKRKKKKDGDYSYEEDNSYDRCRFHRKEKE